MASSKRVLLAISSLAGGGAERVVSVWAGELAEKGYEVAIFVLTRREGEYPVSPDVTIYSVGATKEEYLSTSYIGRYRKMRAILRNFAPDVVISFLFNAQLWMMLSSVGMGHKRVDTVRINPWEMEKSFGRVSRALWRLCFTTADGILIQTESQRGWFKGRDGRKCVVVPNPIASAYTQMERVPAAESVVNLVAAGRLCPQKNYEMMIDGFAKAASRHPELRLRIYGDGSQEYADHLAEHIRSHNLASKIQLMGRSSSMSEVYRSADLFLMTSDYEGLPNSLLEAMACGLPSISTDCLTGPADVIESGYNGFLIPVGDSDALAEAVCRVVEMSRAERDEISEAARNRILSHCSEEKSLCGLCDLIERVTK